MFCTCESAVVPASTLNVVFIAVAVLIGLVWLLLEIWKLDEGENVCVVRLVDCVVCLDWEDDVIFNTLEYGDFC